MTEPNKPRANEERFDTLHNMVTEHLIDRLDCDDPQIADIKAAMDWLKHNGINAPAQAKSSLGSLAGLVPELDFTVIQEKVHGAKALV